MLHRSIIKNPARGAVEREEMKTLKTITLVAALLGSAVFANATPINLVVNGDFSNPNVGGSWASFSNGQVPGWTNILNGDGIEIDDSAILGGPAYPGTTQSAELDGYIFDWISQTISGLTVGAQYNLSWAYGDRPGSGPQRMDVDFGGNLVASNFGTGNNGGLVWTTNNFVVTATNSTEALTFKAIDVGGNSSIGNEITAVSLTATDVPEPASIALLSLGLIGMGAIRRRKIK